MPLMRFLHGFLLLLCDSRFLLVQHALFHAIFLNRIENPHIPQIQRVFENFVRIDAIRQVGYQSDSQYDS